jgi:hypothetical protein
MSLTPADLALAPPDGVEVIAVPHPFSTKHIRFVTDSVATLDQLVREAGVPRDCAARVFIEWDGIVHGPIPKAHWRRIRPKKGTRVTIRAVPSGGGGGDSNKALRTILIAVILIVAIVVTVLSYGAASPLLLAAIPLVASLAIFAVNALLAPGPPKLGSLAAMTGTNANSASPTAFAITGSQNKANPYGPIPKIFGTHQVFPPVADP